MTAHEWLIFFTIQAAMACWAVWESYLEGKSGWTWNPAWWRIKLPGGYFYTAYHIWAFWIFGPLVIIISPQVVAGFSSRLTLVLLFSYLVGTILEDFLWFVVNPVYSFKKWNPKDTAWYPWMNAGFLQLPWSYVLKGLISLIIFYLLLITSS